MVKIATYVYINEDLRNLAKLNKINMSAELEKHLKSLFEQINDPEISEHKQSLEKAKNMVLSLEDLYHQKLGQIKKRNIIIQKLKEHKYQVQQWLNNLDLNKPDDILIAFTEWKNLSPIYAAKYNQDDLIDALKHIKVAQNGNLPQID